MESNFPGAVETTAHEPQVLVVGDWQCLDFAAALDWLQTRLKCVCHDDVAAAVVAAKLASGKRDPEAIVFMQARPGRMAASDVERLHSLTPLARLVALVGPWCDGEMRSGRPWPGVLRVPWNSWSSRLPMALGLETLVSAEVAVLLRTASDVERIEGSVARVARCKRRVASALVCTSSQATYEAVADALKAFGIDCDWQLTSMGAAIPSADLVIFDGWDEVMSWPKPAMCHVRHSTPRLLLLHFPRRQDIDRAAELEIDAVLSHPLWLADLSFAVNRIGLLLDSSRDRRDPIALTPAAGRN